MPPPEVNFVLFLMALVVAGGLGMLTLKFLNWQEERRQNRPIRVNHSAGKYTPISAVEPMRTPDPSPAHARASAENGGIKHPVSVSVSVPDSGITNFDLATVPSDLTYEEVVTILAGQMTPAGKPAYSGKKIYSLVGGNYNEFSALMRRLRTKDEAPAEPPQSTTPIAGRSTRAAFREADVEPVYHTTE